VKVPFEDRMENPQLETAQRSPNIMPTALAFEGGMAVVACAVGGFLKPPLWQQLAWSPRDFALGLLATLPMLVGLLAMRRIERGPLGRLNAVVDQLLVPMFARSSAVQLALISIVAGIGEELLFRGVLQPLLIGWLGLIVGLILASLVFGLLHAVTPTYAVLATIIGIYFGWFARASGNLLGPIVAHAIYDFVALAYLTRSGNSVELRPVNTDELG
jgi:uncharacterized protein